MRTKIFLSILLAFTVSKGHAQDSYIELIYGNSLFRRDLAGQVNTMGNYRLGKPLQYVGVGLNGVLNIKTLCSPIVKFSCNQYLPQDFHANDSVSGRIAGAFFSLSAGSDVLKKNEEFDLVWSLGFQFGRLKLYKDQFLHLRNPSLCPKVTFQINKSFGSCGVGLRAEFVYDISAGDWKEARSYRKLSSSTDVPGFNQTSFNISLLLQTRFVNP